MKSEIWQLGDVSDCQTGCTSSLFLKRPISSSSPSSCSSLSAGGTPCCWGCVMSLCGRKALTLLSSVFAVCALGLLGIAVSTDYWLYLEEGIILPLNQTTDIRMALHSGLWRVCFLAGKQAASFSPLLWNPLGPFPGPGKWVLWTGASSGTIGRCAHVSAVGCCGPHRQRPGCQDLADGPRVERAII